MFVPSKTFIGTMSWVVHIVHKATGLAIDLDEDNKHLVLKSLNNSESQHWIVQNTDWGTYTFVNRGNR